MTMMMTTTPGRCEFTSTGDLSSATFGRVPEAHWVCNHILHNVISHSISVMLVLVFPCNGTLHFKIGGQIPEVLKNWHLPHPLHLMYYITILIGKA